MLTHQNYLFIIIINNILRNGQALNNAIINNIFDVFNILNKQLFY